MKLLVGGVAGVDLPLDESVHAHEGAELLWNQRESAIGEDLCIPGHNFRQRAGRFSWPGLIKEHMYGRKV